MSIRAKVACTSLELFGNDLTSFKFSAVMDGSEENKTWSKWTPSLTLQMQVTNPEVKFEPGKTYYLDFTPTS